MHTLAQKPKVTQKTIPVTSEVPGRVPGGQSRAVDSSFHLKDGSGNKLGISAASGFGFDFSQIPMGSKLPFGIRAKLKIGQPNDKYEQEADRVADQVMRMSGSQVRCVITPNIERDENMELPQSKVSRGDISQVTPNAITNTQSLKGCGQALSKSTRSFFEPRLGNYFGHVRIHSDASTAQTAHSLNALAYTFGNNIVFGAGQFQPNNYCGKHLLAHELVHVIQQSNSQFYRIQRQDIESIVKTAMVSTNYRFDTFKIRIGDISNPDIMTRFIALTRTQLRNYRDKVADQAVKYFINNMLVSRPVTSFDIALGLEISNKKLGVTSSPHNLVSKKLKFNIAVKSNINGIQVIVLSDTHIQNQTLKRAETTFEFTYKFNPKFKDGKISFFRLRQILKIQTVYPPNITRESISGGGRGTTIADIKAGNITLGFHEGNHVLDLIRFLETNQPPRFLGKVGMRIHRWNQMAQLFRQQMEAYKKLMYDSSIALTDCTGKKQQPFCSIHGF